MTAPSRPELHETHSAVVLLAGDRAYKAKKPVDLGFLDFTSLERRAEACRDEVRLNRRFAPEVYLGTATLVDDSTRAPLEHVVMMRRLAGATSLAARVGRGEDVRDAVRAVAHRLGTFHGEHPLDPAFAELVASPQSVQRHWDGCTDAVRRCGQVPEALIDDVADRAATFVAGRHELFAARIAGGYVRDGHGDLQASDVFVDDDGVHLIDCLDFDERLRTGDVAADVGFLAMDLERLGRADLGRLLLEEHARAGGLDAPVALQHFYIAYRAWVRCAVASVRAGQGGPAADAEQLAVLALAHVRLAGPVLVVVSGLPACGKSTFARGLCDERPDWLLLRTDELRDEVVADQPGRYAVASRGAVYDSMLRSAAAALALGTSVVLDATFTERHWRDAAALTAAAARARLVVYECTAPLDVAVARLHERERRGGDPSEVTEDALRRLAATHVPWPGAIRVETDDEAPTSEAVARVTRALV